MSSFLRNLFISHRVGMFRLLVGMIAVVPSVLTSAQSCIIINEIMINPSGPCDGGCAPNTEEWVELYNTCDTPVNIGCFVFGDGDFSVTIPAGTILGPNDFFTIGSVNSGPSVDLNWGTCNCAAGSGIGIFTNNNEQLILADASGALMDAIYWGNGQFPVNISTLGSAGCLAASLNFPSATAAFEQLPTGGGQGCSIARSCDGSSVWVQRCTGVTMDDSNGAPVVPSITSPESVGCPGDCFDFTGEADGPVTTWNWSFPGSNSINSAAQNPSGICYDTPGTFDVTLTITNGCGDFSVTGSEWVIVETVSLPVISPTGPIVLCPGETTTLQTASAGQLQWFLNGAPIPGATASSLVVSVAGNYTVSATANSCEAMSDPVSVTVQTIPVVVLNPIGPITACANQVPALSVNAVFTGYQWMLNGNDIAGATSSTFTPNTSGSYQVELTSGSCVSLSVAISVTITPLPQPSITSNGPSVLCPGDVSLLISSTPFLTYQWLLNGVAISGAGASSYSASAAGSYTLEVSNGGCTGTSAPVVLSASSTIPPSISASPQAAFCTGETITLEATAGFPTYQWLVNAAPISGATSSTLVVSSSGIYSVQSGTGNCAVLSADLNVTELNVPDATLIADGALSFCEGLSVTLNAPAGLSTYEWTLNGTPIPGANASSFVAEESGAYAVQVSNGACDAQSGASVVTVYSPPVISISPPGNEVLCAGESLTLIALPAQEVEWLNNNVPIGVFSEELTVDVAGNYSARTTNAFGCEAISNLVQISFENTPQVSILSNDPDLTACEGELILLQASGNWAQYEWSMNGSMLTNQPSVSAEVSGLYALTATSAAGCESSDEATLIFNAAPQPVILPLGDLIACDGETVVLNADVFASYQWTFSGVPIAGANASTLNCEQSGPYGLIVSADNGCEAFAESVSVTIAPEIAVNILSSPAQPCVGEEAILSLSQNYASIVWSTNSFDATIEVEESGLYSAQVLDQFGCSGSGELELIFTEMPVANAGPDWISDCSGPISIGSVAAGGVIDWSPASLLSDPNVEIILVNPTTITTYTLTVTNGSCVATDEVTIEADCFSFFAPNAFTPDNDGINDVFMPVFRGVEHYSIVIVDRWGNPVFRSEDPNRAWTGEVNGGQHYAADGVYLWRIVFRYIGSIEEKEVSGHVVLIR